MRHRLHEKSTRRQWRRRGSKRRRIKILPVSCSLREYRVNKDAALAQLGDAHAMQMAEVAKMAEEDGLSRESRRIELVQRANERGRQNVKKREDELEGLA